MAQTDCQRCQRDIHKPALVRCQDAACPLKEARARVSPVKVIGATSVLGMALAAIIFWISMATSPSQPAASSAKMRMIPLPATHRIETGGDSGWLGWLWKTERPVVIDSAPAAIRDDTPDPRAASRVQSFPCDEKASIGRALICTHWTLAITDYNVTLLYKDVLSHSADPHALTRARRAWLAKLDKKGVDKASILALYEAWRTELAKAAD